MLNKRQIEMKKKYFAQDDNNNNKILRKNLRLDLHIADADVIR